MKTIRNISVSSVFKVSCILYALLFAVAGCLGLVLPMSLAGPLFNQENLVALGATNEQAIAIIQAMGVQDGSYLITVIIGYAIALVVVSFIGALVLAIAALIYNLIARIVGGVQVHIE